MKSILVFSAALIISLGANAGKGGGATTVGDGGVVVKCHGQDLQILDLFEQKVLSGDKEITLDKDDNKVQRKVADGLARIQQRYSLTEDEMKPIRRAADQFMRFPYDPFHDGSASFYGYFLQINKIVVRSEVAQALKDQNCRLETAVIRPPHDGSLSEEYYQGLCGHNFAEYESCFYTNLDLWRALKKDQRACLVIHELLRYLPADKRAPSELEMRAEAADVCTL